jgi:hypothetical protein
MWVFATRNRVENCKRFIKLWHELEASSPIYLRLDEDDPALEEMKSLPWPKEFIMVVGPRVRLGGSMQEMFKAYPNEPFYGLLADDLIPETMHWDKKLIDAAGLDDMSYADEVYEKEVRICHPCIGGDLVRHVGFFAIPGLKHFCTDTFWEQLYHHFGRDNRQKDIILAHAHFNFNQSAKDQTYSESQAIRQDDKRTFRDWKEKHWEETVASVKQRFGW